jgi:hypothetical protein
LTTSESGVRKLRDINQNSTHTPPHPIHTSIESEFLTGNAKFVADIAKDAAHRAWTVAGGEKQLNVCGPSAPRQRKRRKGVFDNGGFITFTEKVGVVKPEYYI